VLAGCFHTSVYSSESLGDAFGRTKHPSICAWVPMIRSKIEMASARIVDPPLFPEDPTFFISLVRARWLFVEEMKKLNSRVRVERCTYTKLWEQEGRISLSLSRPQPLRPLKYRASKSRYSRGPIILCRITRNTCHLSHLRRTYHFQSWTTVILGTEIRFDLFRLCLLPEQSCNVTARSGGSRWNSSISLFVWSNNISFHEFPVKVA
jgi:hypothetical protein